MSSLTGHVGTARQSGTSSPVRHLQPPINKINKIFIAGRPKAALLLWFFGDFRCGALLFVVIHGIYVNIKIGKNSC